MEGLRLLRGGLLLPGSSDDVMEWVPDGAVVVRDGKVEYAGDFGARPGGQPGPLAEKAFMQVGVLIPPLLDCHIHIPQHPIRGRFVEGVEDGVPGGKLLAGLARNVFPAEMRCAQETYTREVVAEFLRETRANGTHGGVAYMTAHPSAARIALEMLPASWRLGLVLMDVNCLEGLRISSGTAHEAMEGLARDFGQRVVITDRFAVACSSELRRAGVEVARRHGLETQTHLAEQPGEIALIRKMYPWAESYTHVYEEDGLLSCGALLAHCIHMSEKEWEILARSGSGSSGLNRARVAHCPVSNTELDSGVMDLEAVYKWGLDYAVCTDVGASPTTSLLCEMKHFLAVHKGKSARATPSTALFRTTVGAKRVGRIDVGGMQVGQKFAATEILGDVRTARNADEAILGLLGRPADSVAQVALEMHGRARTLDEHD